MTSAGRRRLRLRRTVAALGILLLGGCSSSEAPTGSASLGSGVGSSTASPSRATASPGDPNAELPPQVTRTGPFRPSGADSFDDEPDYYGDGCRFLSTEDTPPPAGRCRYGDPLGAPVAIVGDSKIGQWMPALQRIAVAEKWQLIFYSRSSCPFATEGVSATCASFVEQVAARLREQEPPRLVFVSHIARSDPVVASETAQLTRLHDLTGARAVVVEDTPQPGRESVPACLATARDYWIDCALRKNDGSGTPGLRRVADAVPDARLITLNDVICPTEKQCPPVLDGIALYRAGSHLTKTFVEATAPTLHRRLIDAGVASGPAID